MKCVPDGIGYYFALYCGEINILQKMAACAVTTYLNSRSVTKLLPHQKTYPDPRSEFIKRHCYAKTDTKIKVFVPIAQIISDDTSKIRKVETGKRYMNPPERVIMVVGETGSGKSTLINAMYNHMCGVEWEDNFRFKLIDEDISKTTAQSQTQWITAYTIHHQPWFTIPYTLTIIDTPGFGQTTGIQRDKEIVEQIRAGFHVSGPNGIDQLDAVAFVEPATSFRLTNTHRYILDETLSIFGKNIEDNIFMFFHFLTKEFQKFLAHFRKPTSNSGNILTLTMLTFSLTIHCSL